MSGASLQSLVQLFFTERLQKQLGASSHTIAAYRDAFRLLFKYASEHLERAPSELRIEDLHAPSWASSSTTWKPLVETARGRETTASPPYTPSSNMWPSANPPWPCTANACWRSLPSVMSAVQWSS